MWSQKKAGLYPCTRQISPYSCFLSRWPTAVQTSSSRLCFHAVSDVGTTLCNARSSVLCPMSTSWSFPFGWHRACLATPGGLLSHSEPSRAASRASLTYRNTLKSFTSILNGNVYLFPPVANTNRQAIFHLFVELWEGVIHSKHFGFHSMEKSEHFLRYNFSDLFWKFIDQILPKVFLFYSMDTTGSRKISSAIDV